MGLSPSELDYSRAKRLEENAHLRAIICAAPVHRTFEGRGRSVDQVRSLDERQSYFFQLRVEYQTTKNLTRLDELAVRLPLLDDELERQHTGVIYRQGGRLIQSHEGLPVE